MHKGCSYGGELARLGGGGGASSPRRDDFYPTFIWNLLSQFFYVAGKRLFDQVVFKINSDVKPSCRPNVLILFN